MGVVIEELIDGGDDGGGGLAELRGVWRDGQGEGGVLACGQADVRGDGVAGPGKIIMQFLVFSPPGVPQKNGKWSKDGPLLLPFLNN